jgi:hypothetical protein
MMLGINMLIGANKIQIVSLSESGLMKYARKNITQNVVKL